MTWKLAEELKLKILGKIIHVRAVGVPPDIMGVGPAYAIPRVLKDCGMTKE